MLVAETMLGILGLLDEGARGRQRELGFAKSTLGARRAARHDVAHNCNAGMEPCTNPRAQSCDGKVFC